MKKSYISILTAGFLMTGFAQAKDTTLTLNVDKGWSLLGSNVDTLSSDINGYSDLSKFWMYNNGDWEGGNPNEKTNIQIKAGNGFWVKSENSNTVSLTINGNLDDNDILSIKSGWNLASIKDEANTKVKLDKFNKDTISSLWIYRDSEWLGMTNGKIVGDIKDITTGEGFWIKSDSDISLDLKDITSDVLPKDDNQVALSNDNIVVYEVSNSISVPKVIGGAKIYKLVGENELEEIGSTDFDGFFNIGSNSIKKDDVIFVTKHGYTVANFKVDDKILKSGKSIAISKLENKSLGISNGTVDIGNGLPNAIKTGVLSLGDATVKFETEFSKNPEVGDITISANVFTNDNKLIDLESGLDIDGEIIPSKELFPLGGITFKISKVNNFGEEAEIIADKLGNIDGLDLRLEQYRLIGGLGESLNLDLVQKQGKSREEAIQYSLEVLKKLNELIAISNSDNQTVEDIGLYILQKDTNPSINNWDYKGYAKIVHKGGELFSLELDDSAEKLNSFGDIVFVLRYPGEMTKPLPLCVIADRIEYGDGEEKEKLEPFEKVSRAVITGDATISEDSQFLETNDEGKVEVYYTEVDGGFNVNVSKHGYHDTSVYITANEISELDGNCKEIRVAKIAPTNAIEGYVIDSLSDKGIPHAQVLLKDPKILIQSKVDINDERFKLVFEENVDYLWELVRIDKDGSETDLGVLKEGIDKDSTILSIDEILSYITTPFEDDTTKFDSPIAKYKIKISVTHHYDNKDNVLEERAFIDINTVFDEFGFKVKSSFSVNETAPYVKDADKDGYTTNIETIMYATEKLKKLGIYGGKEVDLWEALYEIDSPGKARNAVKHYWETSLVADLDRNDVPEDIICIDENQTNIPTIKVLGADNCYANVVPERKVVEQRAEFPYIYLTGFISDNFDSLIKPSLSLEDRNNGEIRLTSGFTVFNIYNSIDEMYDPETREDDTYIANVQSFTNVEAGTYNEIKDALMIDGIVPHLENPIVFETRETFTLEFPKFPIEENDEELGSVDQIGYYRFKIDEKDLDLVAGLELKARASGYITDIENYKMVDPFGEANSNGDKVLRYDFYLNKVCDIEGIECKPPVEDDEPPRFEIVFDFENPDDYVFKKFDDEDLDIEQDWVVEDITVVLYEDIKENIVGMYNTLEDVTWNIVSNDNLPLTNEFYKSNISEAITAILPTNEEDGSKYAWFGNKNSGTFTNTPDSWNSTAEVGKVLVSPLIDFSNLSMARVDFKAWFEVSNLGDRDTAFVGFVIPEEMAETGENVELDWVDGSEKEVQTGVAYMKRLSKIIDTPPAVPDGMNSIASNEGLALEPQWQDYSLSFDILAGKKAQLIFGFITSDETNNNFRGFGIDTIRIYDDWSAAADNVEIANIDVEDIQEQINNYAEDIEMSEETADVINKAKAEVLEKVAKDISEDAFSPIVNPNFF